MYIDESKVRQRVENKGIDDVSYFHRFIETRLRADEIYYTEKKNNIVLADEEVMEEIKAWWEERIPHTIGIVNFDMFDVYNKFESDKSKLKFYVPDSFFYGIIDEYYSNPQRSIPLDDKNLYDLLFHDINRPKTLFRKIGNKYYDVANNEIYFDDVLSIAKAEKNIVLKASIQSYGGHGVMFLDNIDEDPTKLVEALQNTHYFRPKRSSRARFEIIAQRVVKQHQTLSDICSTSINTVRIMTMDDTKKGAVALSSILRMGINGKRVDNASSGGIFCGINADGTLKNVAYDTTAKLYDYHPDGKEFAGVMIPGYNKLVALAVQLQNRFVGVSRLISWDFAIDENGEPLLIEMNISFGELDFHQMCNGPIFGDRLSDILDEVIVNSYSLRRLF